VFRFKRSIPLPYVRQGYIYFISRKYNELTQRQRERIDGLCAEAGGEYAAALLEFVTTDKGEVAICLKHHVSDQTLRRCVRRYYLAFPERL